MSTNHTSSRAKALIGGLVASLALVSCGGSEAEGGGTAPSNGSAIAQEVSDSASRLAEAAKVDWASVTEWTEAQRTSFLEYAQAQFTEAQKAGQSYLDRMAEVAEEKRPEARKALERYHEKAQGLRMEIFKAGEKLKEASATSFSESRTAISKARAELFLAYDELKSYFSS
ncbi:MAG: hypothetical protein GC161_19335 [Planctomycetaceae bacterium]|nr:hypothetical protein [Planctomycetaceae bacterium]